MENRNELQENNIKNCMCYYFDDIITNRDIYSVDIFIQFITFYTKLELVENHCILGSIKLMVLLGFLMVKLNI